MAANCKDCGAPLPEREGRGRRPERCPEHQRAREIVRARESSQRREARGRKPYGAKSAVCTGGCGKVVWLGTGSRTDPTCRECRRLARVRVCVRCGKEFDHYAKHNGRLTIYCSSDCSRADQAEKLALAMKACKQCGKDFKPVDHRPQFCSQRCYWDSLRRDPALPGHTVIFPLGLCAWCLEDMLAPHGNKRYHRTCAYQHNKRQTADRIMERYYSDAAFKADMIARTKAVQKKNRGDLLDRLTIRSGGLCGICQKPVTTTTGPWRPSVDHIIPRKRGGSDDESNLQLSHYRCNLWKNDRLQEELVEGNRVRGYRAARKRSI